MGWSDPSPEPLDSPIPLAGTQAPQGPRWCADAGTELWGSGLCGGPWFRLWLWHRGWGPAGRPA